ncbi:hypothetical protein BJ742DRAFT_852420 [Cladochytrium replicatum]|nr:hypothetical protein BJ742DRAFT_852420 [Cladochytrium replicatum]
MKVSTSKFLRKSVVLAHRPAGGAAAAMHRTAATKAVAHHDDHHGQEYQEHGSRDKRPYWWEGLWYVGYYGSFATFFFLYWYSPRQGPTDIAKAEAHRRLAARGEEFAWPLPPGYKISEDGKK